MRPNLMLRACCALSLFIAVVECHAGTPTYSTGSIVYSHDPDDGNASPSPFNKTVLSVPGTMPGSFQINNTFNNAASSSIATGKTARFASTSQAGFDLGTGTGVTQSDGSNVYNGSSVLTMTFDMTFDIGTGANAFGANVTGYGAFLIGGSMGPGGSATFNATINYTNFSKATSWRSQSIFSQTFNNPGGSPALFSMGFQNNKYLNAPLNQISNDRLRIWGSVVFKAHNLGGPSDLTPLYCELSGAPPTGTWNAEQTVSAWNNPANWLSSPTSGTPEDPIVANGVGMRARFRSLTTSIGTQTLNLEDVATTIQTLDISSERPLFIAGGLPLTFDAESGNALIFVTPTYGDGTHTIGGAGAVLNDDLDIDIRGNSSFKFISGINGPGAINQIGPGTTEFSSGLPNGYTGGTNLKNGFLDAQGPGSLGTGPVSVTGGQLNWLNPNATSQVVQVGANGQVSFGFPPIATSIVQVADLGAVQGSFNELQALNAGNNLLISPGGMIVHETFDTLPGIGNPQGLGGIPQYNFGIANNFTAAGVSFVCGSGSGTVWNGFGSDRGVRTFGGAGSQLTLIGTGELVSLNEGRLNLNASLTASGVLPRVAIKRGNGQFAVNAASNPFNGSVIVEGGDLVVNGDMPNVTGTQVQSGARLGGNGFVGGNTQVGTGGAVSPGDGDFGTFQLQNLNMISGSHLEFDLSTAGIVGGTANDLIEVLGTVSLSGVILDINALDDFAEGPGGYTLMRFPTGNFSGGLPTIGDAPGDIGYSLSIVTDLTGSSLVLNAAIPEPGSLLALGAMGLLLMKRSRR